MNMDINILKNYPVESTIYKHNILVTKAVISEAGKRLHEKYVFMFKLDNHKNTKFLQPLALLQT